MFPRRLLPASLIVLGVLFGASAQASPAHGQAFGKPAQAAQASRSIEVVLGDMYFKRGRSRSRPARRSASC